MDKNEFHPLMKCDVLGRSIVVEALNYCLLLLAIAGGFPLVTNHLLEFGYSPLVMSPSMDDSITICRLRRGRGLPATMATPNKVRMLPLLLVIGISWGSS
jgi:hypothetical protein